MNTCQTSIKTDILFSAAVIHILGLSRQTRDHRESCSTIGEDGDTTIPSPGRSPKQPLPEIGLHDPLHGRQACPEFNSFHKGSVKYVPGRGYFRAVPPKPGTDLLHPRPPSQSLNGS